MIGPLDSWLSTPAGKSAKGSSMTVKLKVSVILEEKTQVDDQKEVQGIRTLLKMLLRFRDFRSCRSLRISVYIVPC